jgi:hypothetical protein
MVGFVAAFALRLVRAGEHAAGIAVGAGLTTVVAYLLALHTVYLSLSYGIAAESAGVTKGLFVATILAVPVFGLGVATLLFAAALGSRRANLMPKLWQLATLGAGTLCTISVFSYADSGFFSPDVQQQLVAHVLLIWLTTTSVVGAIAERGVRQRDLAREVDVYRAWRSSRIA